MFTHRKIKKVLLKNHMITYIPRQKKPTILATRATMSSANIARVPASRTFLRIDLKAEGAEAIGGTQDQSPSRRCNPVITVKSRLTLMQRPNSQEKEQCTRICIWILASMSSTYRNRTQVKNMIRWQDIPKYLTAARKQGTLPPTKTLADISTHFWEKTTEEQMQLRIQLLILAKTRRMRAPSSSAPSRSNNQHSTPASTSRASNLTTD